MRNFKKFVSIVCCVTCLIAVLSGCGSSGSNTSGSSASPAASPAVSNFPTNTVNIVCHASAGGGTDSMLREVASILQDTEHWTVTVENKTGGSGSVAMQYVAASKADGYTLCSAPVELSMVKALGYANLGPDDVQLLGCAYSNPAALYVKSDAPYNTLQEFVDYCKANPGKVTVANSGIGSIWHIAACVLADKTKIELSHVPYNGASGAVTALLGGEANAMVVGASEGYSYVESGDFKCLATFADSRSDVLPNVPTAKEEGYDISVYAWAGLLAPKGMDEATMNTLVETLRKCFESDEYKAYCKERGCDSTYYDPAAFQKMAQEDFEYYTKLITDLGIAK